METIILVGGKGTRMGASYGKLPKGLATIGGRPIVTHIMDIYAAHGFDNFILAAGFRWRSYSKYFRENRSPYSVEVVDTGPVTETGGRLKRFEPDATFMATYGDGVGDIDIAALMAFHKSHGKLATLTACRPPARFGALTFDGDRVATFQEKVQGSEGWVNAGFYVLEPGVLDYIAGDETKFEVQPLEQLAQDRQLMAYKHEGFWQPMDVTRERSILQNLWDSGHPPWLSHAVAR